MRLKKFVVAGAATAALVGAIAVAPTANAYASVIRSYVWWSGPDCIPVEISRAPDGFGTDVGQACGGHSERTYVAVPGQFVGADPMPNDTTVTVGCQLWIDGVLRLTDYAPPG